MRTSVSLIVATFIGSATCCVAEEPAAQVVRNPYFYDSSLVGDRYQHETAEAPSSPSVHREVRSETTTEWTGTSAPAARPVSTTTIDAGRSAERMQAIAVGFGRSTLPVRTVPARFTPVTDAKPLAKGDDHVMRSDAAVSPAALYAAAQAAPEPSYVSLTTALAERLAVTRLTSNPLRDAEKAPRSASPSIANPLR